jgi:hypothetical protein
VVVRAEVAVSIPRLTEGFVEGGGGLESVRVRGDRGTADVIAEEEGQSPTRADGEASTVVKVQLLLETFGQASAGTKSHAVFDLVVVRSFLYCYLQ